MDNEVTQSLILWSAELGDSSHLVPIKMVLQGAGVTVDCLSWHNVLYELFVEVMLKVESCCYTQPDLIFHYILSCMLY